MSPDHGRKREPVAAMLARQRADLGRAWNDAILRRGGAAAMFRSQEHLHRIQEAREAEATLIVDHVE